MHARRLVIGLLVLSALGLVSACQTAQVHSTSPIQPVRLDATLEPIPVLQGESGVHLSASISSACGGAAQPESRCAQPYAGEFVVTELNGAVVTNVLTDSDGQATVNLPAGNYLLGVMTGGAFPRAAPLQVNVPAGRYVDISLSLDAGTQP